MYIIPDGDWYCPKCENEQLLTKLKFEFENYVSNLAKREREQLRKERLKYVEINIGNILTEDSTSRKNKAKKKFDDYYDDSDLDSDLEDDDENELNSDTSNYDSDNSSTVNRTRKKYSSNSNSRRNKNSSTYERRSRPVQRPRIQKQRKRRRSYSDESDDDSNSEELDSDQDESSNDSLPKQRSARKRVSYQFKEYDELINSAIQASDYDDYVENEEQDEDDEEEEESDDGKSPFSKGKDISNLMAMAENPFEPKEKEKDVIIPDQTSTVVEVNAVTDIQIDDHVMKDNQPVIDKDDERKVIPEQQENKKKGKLKSKRKLNDLDSPIEEAENDSDFTIKDESNTELEDDDTEMDSNDFSNESEDEDTELSDWARNTRKRSTRSGGRSNKRSKKRRRFESDDDESDYGYKTRRRVSKRVTYKEISTSEEDFDDDYSDNSEKFGKKKKKANEKKKKIESETDEYSTGQDSDERAVIKKKKIKKKLESSNEEDAAVSTPEDGKRKSKREHKKKVYNDFTDLDESEDNDVNEQNPLEEEPIIEEMDQINKEKPISEQPLSNAKNEMDEMLKIEVTQVRSPLPANVHELSVLVDKVPAKRTPKIKITKPNPKLNKNINNVQMSSSLIDPSTEISQVNLLNTSIESLPLNSNNLDQQFNNNLIEDATDVKKKRSRQPKDPNAPTAKRGRKPKTSLSDLETITGAKDLVNINTNSNKLESVPNSASIPHPIQNPTLTQLSQLTQFANAGNLDKFDPTASKFLPNPSQMAAIDHMKNQLLNANKNLQFNPLLAQQEFIARQTAIINANKSKYHDRVFFLDFINYSNQNFLIFFVHLEESQLNDSSTPKTKSSKSSKSPAKQSKTSSATNLPVSTSVTTETSVTNNKSNISTLNSLTSAMAHSQSQKVTSGSHPLQASIHHFPQTHPASLSQSIHNANSSAAAAALNHARQNIPNPHTQTLMNAAPQLPPNYGLPGHPIPSHNPLHNPYYPNAQLPNLPQGAHLPLQYGNPMNQHHPNLPPQLASQLANHQFRFPGPYPTAPFGSTYDPYWAANAQYFGHHVPPNYPTSMGNPPYYPPSVQSNHQISTSHHLPPQPSPISQTSNLLPPPSTTNNTQISQTNTSTTVSQANLSKTNSTS